MHAAPAATAPATAGRTQAAGFTLVELMISIALVLLLILGVNQVFSIASRGVGAGQAMSTVTRDNRAIQAVLYDDLRFAVTAGAPWIIIDSGATRAYTSREDELSDTDANMMTIDLDGDNVEGEAAVPGEQISDATYNTRNHRTDIFNFFARGQIYRRSTGNDAEYVNAGTSGEVWVSYGHMRMFDLSAGGLDGDATLANYPAPGEVPALGNPNPDNYHARNWVLGRNQFLLTAAVAGQRHFAQGAGDHTALRAHAPGTPANLHTEDTTGKSASGDTGKDFAIAESRLDLARTTIDFERQSLIAALTANPALRWWDGLSYRFIVNPYVPKPLTSRGMAQASPYLLGSVTQFMVEYAGDFVAQDPAANGAVLGWYGQAAPNGTDGEVDYIVSGTAPNQTRRIRWYGLPRDVDGVPGIKGTGGDAPPGGVTLYTDVVPLRDYLVGSGVAAPVTFERFTDINNTPLLPPKPDYAAYGPAGLAQDNRYVCAWGPGDTVKPKMIRITMTLDDPNGRLNEGQTYEYVIPLP